MESNIHEQTAPLGVKGATEMQGRRSILKPGLDLAALASSFRTDDVVKDLSLPPNRNPVRARSVSSEFPTGATADPRCMKTVV